MSSKKANQDFQILSWQSYCIFCKSSSYFAEAPLLVDNSEYCSTFCSVLEPTIGEQCPHQHTIGHFGDESFQSITCTGTANIVTFSNMESRQSLHCNGHFYHATLRISAVFAVARCLSVTFMYCNHIAEDTFKLYPRLGSPITLVFWSKAQIPKSTGNPYSGGAKYKGEGNFFAIFVGNRVYFRNGTRQVHGCCGTLIWSHTSSIEWWHFQWLWRTPNPVFKVMVYLKLNISKTVHLRDKVRIEHW